MMIKRIRLWGVYNPEGELIEAHIFSEKGTAQARAIALTPVVLTGKQRACFINPVDGLIDPIDLIRGDFSNVTVMGNRIHCPDKRASRDLPPLRQIPRGRGIEQLPAISPSERKKLLAMKGAIEHRLSKAVPFTFQESGSAVKDFDCGIR